MARCEICSRRIPPHWRFCGKNDCTAKPEQVLPRCKLCGNIATDGMKDCITTGGAHIPEDIGVDEEGHPNQGRYCTTEERKKKVGSW